MDFSSPQPARLKVLVFIVAYNAEKVINSVLDRIPKTLGADYDTEVLVIDDCSRDATAEVVQRRLNERAYGYPVTVLRNPVNLGYGGNQKVGYRYAILNGFDVVVLLHGDGQYAPEKIPDMLLPFTRNRRLGAVFGSRMLTKANALRGGMPLYKFVGNQVLTWLQNRLLGSQLSEFHTGYRAYSTATLAAIPFEYNTNDFHFDTEIIVQLHFARSPIEEIAIPTFYGDEVCHVNGMKYAGDVMRASVKAFFISLGIFYDPKFDVAPPSEKKYVSKLSFLSTHSVALDLVKAGSRVVDLGCADGYLSDALHRHKQCTVVATDLEVNKSIPGCEYQRCDLNHELPHVEWGTTDVVVMLDVIEHLADPEKFLQRLRVALSANRAASVIMSSGNVCFFVTRMMMLLGQFNYGKRGILDMTHTRLFTVASLDRLLRYAGYQIDQVKVIPAPYPLAIGLNRTSRAMLKLNALLARVIPGLFAYQTLIVARPRPTADFLLQNARHLASAP
jgi:glycosyltransferase involved in cell wall biosynthesis